MKKKPLLFKQLFAIITLWRILGVDNMNEEEMELKNNAIIHKDNSLTRLDLSFLTHIELSEYKKSDLLAYWIKDFAEYHDQERTFNIAKSGVYSRGDVIKVNLGFNIGNELGGLHYCIVLNKYDNTRNGTLNVVPLTSRKDDKRYDLSTVNLGKEFILDFDYCIGADAYVPNIIQYSDCQNAITNGSVLTINNKKYVCLYRRSSQSVKLLMPEYIDDWGGIINENR